MADSLSSSETLWRPLDYKHRSNAVYIYTYIKVWHHADSTREETEEKRHDTYHLAKQHCTLRRLG